MIWITVNPGYKNSKGAFLEHVSSSDSSVFWEDALPYRLHKLKVVSVHPSLNTQLCGEGLNVFHLIRLVSFRKRRTLMLVKLPPRWCRIDSDFGLFFSKIQQFRWTFIHLLFAILQHVRLKSTKTENWIGRDLSSLQALCFSLRSKVICTVGCPQSAKTFK